MVGRDSSVGIATRYGLDGPGIEFRSVRDFLQPSRPALGPIQPPVQWVLVLSLEVKVSGSGVYQSPPSSAELKERVQLYLYSLFGLRDLFWGELYLFPLFSVHFIEY